jgi:hypothetical protein
LKTRERKKREKNSKKSERLQRRPNIKVFLCKTIDRSGKPLKFSAGIFPKQDFDWQSLVRRRSGLFEASERHLSRVIKGEML